MYENIKIYFTGSSSTGKSTQMNYFTERFPHFHTTKPRRRKLAEDGVININKNISVPDEIIMAGDVLEGIFNTPSPSIADRSWVDKCAYAQASSLSEEEKSILHLLFVRSFPGFSPNDYYIFFPNMVEYEDDEVRHNDKDYREEVSFYIQFYLHLFNIDFLTLKSSTIEERHLEIREFIEL